jgi:shikimate kinase
MKFHNNIVLIGMPGSGKTSLGSIIAERLELDFYDIDQYIQEKENKTISELFLLGESHFRQIESNAIREVSSKKTIVIATGGGVVTRSENIAVLQQKGTIFYIDRPIEMIIETIDVAARPLLADNVKRIYSLYEQRKHLYEGYCHYRITNGLSLHSAVEQILKVIVKSQDSEQLAISD